MNNKQRKLSQIVSSFLIVLLPIALKLIGLNWVSAIAIGVILSLALLILSSSFSKRIQNFSSWIGYGLIAIAVALIAVVGIPQINSNFQTPDLTSGYVGGERYDLLVRDPRVQKLLLDADIQLSEGSVTKKGSVSQLKALATQAELGDIDFLWTGDAPIAEGGKQLIEANGITVLDNEATFSDPLVLVVDQSAALALANSKFFTAIANDHSLHQFGFQYRVDAITLADFLTGKWTWQDVGLTRYVSSPGIIMSNARKSNGGVMAETLIGTIWHNFTPDDLLKTRLLTSADIKQFKPLPPQISSRLLEMMEQLRLNSGFAESTSSKIQVQLEEGGIPWALTYYSLGRQIVADNSDFTLVALSHTLVNSNQFLSFSEQGTKLLEIIQSPEFQKIAFEYGYDTPKGDWSVLPDPSFKAIKSLTNLID